VYGATVPEIEGEKAIPYQIEASSIEAAGTETDTSGSLDTSVAPVAMIGAR
jgi:hypothetical protein